MRNLLLLFIAVSAVALLCPPSAHALDPCCAIAAIDARTGVVTARVNASGQTFQFNAGSALRQLRVGQSIYANLATKQVSVNGAVPCCEIINVGVAPVDGVRSPAQSTTLGSTATSSAAGNTAGEQAARGAVNPGDPCCQITAINSSTGVVSAKVNSTGQTFEFNAGSALTQLRVGQSIYANLATKQVSVNGSIPCCQIINVGVAPVDGVRSPAQSTTLGSTASSSASSGAAGISANLQSFAIAPNLSDPTGKSVLVSVTATPSGGNLAQVCGAKVNGRTLDLVDPTGSGEYAGVLPLAAPAGISQKEVFPIQGNGNLTPKSSTTTAECHMVPCPPNCKSPSGAPCVVCISCSVKIVVKTGSQNQGGSSNK